MEEKLIPEFEMKMGQDLYTLLQNIETIPTPPPTNNNNSAFLETDEEYRKTLVNYLSTLNSVDDFLTNTNDIFLSIIPSSCRK